MLRVRQNEPRVPEQRDAERSATPATAPHSHGRELIGS